MQAMRRPGDNHRVEPCDICGDVGFPEVIATCSKCNIVREHVYCMRDYLKEVHEDWLCDSCQSRIDVVSPKCGGNKNFPGDFGSDASFITHHDIPHTTRPCKLSRKSGWHAFSKRQKPVIGKVKLLSEEEVIKLSHGSFAPRPVAANSGRHMARKTSVGTKNNVIPMVPSLTVKSNPPIIPMGLGKLPRNSAVQKNSMIDQQPPCSLSKGSIEDGAKRFGEEKVPVSGGPVFKSKTSKAIIDKANGKAPCSTAASSLLITAAASIKEHICVKLEVMDEVMPVKEVETFDLQMEKNSKHAPCAALQARQSSPIFASDGICHALGEGSRSNVEEKDLQSIQTNFKLYRTYLPSLHATWRGGFQLQTAVIGEFYDGLEAKPPCMVNHKAYKFSCKMPTVLQVEPLPTSNLLTDLFHNDCPDLQDVALYFFPSDNIERSRRNLSSIFEFMDSKSSMLRSFINGVELLVFTSKQLTVDSQGYIARVNAGCFLWGVFRPVKNDKGIERLPNTAC